MFFFCFCGWGFKMALSSIQKIQGPIEEPWPPRWDSFGTIFPRPNIRQLKDDDEDYDHNHNKYNYDKNSHNEDDQLIYIYNRKKPKKKNNKRRRTTNISISVTFYAIQFD